MATPFDVFLVSPEREIWSGRATIVVARGTEGEGGILAGHTPMLIELGISPPVITTEAGGRRLSGSVKVGGAKNSALKLMAAALLAEGTTVIENVPRIVDCLTMGEVLEHLGAGVQWEGSTLTIDTSNAAGVETPYELVRK